MVELIKEKPKWELIRERDELTKQSEKIMWLEWNDNGTFKSNHDKPVVGRSLLMSPFINGLYTWLTTEVTEIIEQHDDYIKFKTQNSTYELRRI